jgi:hypothetical protein
VRQFRNIRRDPLRLIVCYQSHSAGTHRKVARKGGVLSRKGALHLVLVFIVAVGLYVLGMIVLALAAIIGRVRGNRELKKLEPELR